MRHHVIIIDIIRYVKQSHVTCFYVIVVFSEKIYTSIKSSYFKHVKYNNGSCYSIFLHTLVHFIICRFLRFPEGFLLYAVTPPESGVFVINGSCGQ